MSLVFEVAMGMKPMFLGDRGDRSDILTICRLDCRGGLLRVVMMQAASFEERGRAAVLEAGM